MNARIQEAGYRGSRGSPGAEKECECMQENIPASKKDIPNIRTHIREGGEPGRYYNY